MSASDNRVGELERLVDRHIELSELFEGRKSFMIRPFGNRPGPRHLITAATRRGDAAKSAAECLSDLVDRALVAYEAAGFAQDSTILALKRALLDAIDEAI